MELRDSAAGEQMRVACPKQENKGLYSVPPAGHVRHNSTSSNSPGPLERTCSLYVICFVSVPDAKGLPDANAPSVLAPPLVGAGVNASKFIHVYAEQTR